MYQIEGEGTVREDRESQLFPDPEQHSVKITCHFLTPEFLIFGTQVSSVVLLNNFL